MMTFQAVATSLKRSKADVIVVPFFKGKKGAEESVSLPDLKGEIAPILKEGDFSGKMGSTMLVYLSRKKEKRLLLLGLGEREKCTGETLRRAYASCMKRCQNKKWPILNVLLPKLKNLSPEEVCRTVTEGIGLSLYLFQGWKSKESQKVFHTQKIRLIGIKETKIAKKTTSLLSGVNLARELINGNALDVTPQALSAEAKKLARDYTSVKATILDKKRIEKEKMGLLLAVASGSRVDPALIQLEYQGNPQSDDLTLVVGKGITFDSGGLNLKPVRFIEDQRADMSGGAAALGIIKAAAALKLKANIAVLIPSTENGIDARSYKPGDVYRSYSGITVEITNTDAEGRLVLADALSYGQKHFSPSRVIDIATLTGAVVVALGEERAGLYCNDDKLAKLCEQAGETTGERVWRMPLDVEYKQYIESDIADLRNTGSKRAAGSITAAMFLREFIEKKTPWIHLDVAGTAFLDRARDYHLTLATGAGVRLIIELLERLHEG